MLRSDAPTQRLGLGPQRFAGGGLAAVALAAALMVWVAVEATTNPTAPPPPTGTVTATSPAELERLAASINHWIFWVGPRRGYTYELSQLSDGTVSIRYLPSGGTAGSGGPYLTVATYPFLNASLVMQGLAGQSCCTAVSVPGSGSGEYPNSNPNDVFLGYPGVDYQIEVYDSTPGSAVKLVTSGRVAPVIPASA